MLYYLMIYYYGLHLFRENLDNISLFLSIIIFVKQFNCFLFPDSLAPPAEIC